MLSYFAGSLAIFICLISCVLSAASTLSLEFPSSVVFKDHTLQKSPSLFKSDYRPYGTVGILFYTYYKGIPYILLARESGGIDQGTYSEFGGSLELKADGKPETFLDGCIRECYEESAELYKPTADKLLQSKIYFETSPTGREIVVCLVETAQIYQSTDLLDAQAKFSDEHFREKDALLWIRANDLLAGKGIDPSTNNTIILRPFLKNLLNKPGFRKMIEELDQQKIAA